MPRKSRTKPTSEPSRTLLVMAVLVCIINSINSRLVANCRYDAWRCFFVLQSSSLLYVASARIGQRREIIGEKQSTDMYHASAAEVSVTTGVKPLSCINLPSFNAVRATLT
ncbi:hypothetical protein V8C26DRAFT_388815 [Trichoderma gracile]